jgi:DNA-binding winged helix-turn-helix (wHTH) protein
LYKLGIWIVHPQKFSIEHDGKEVKLKSLIMKLLLLFIESEGKAISKEELLEKCWHGRVVTDDAIRQAIKELRSALNSHNDNIEYIQTIRKHGYRLLPDVELITTAQETPFALFFKKTQNNSHLLNSNSTYCYAIRFYLSKLFISAI